MSIRNLVIENEIPVWIDYVLFANDSASEICLYFDIYKVFETIMAVVIVIPSFTEICVHMICRELVQYA